MKLAASSKLPDRANGCQWRCALGTQMTVIAAKRWGHTKNADKSRRWASLIVFLGPQVHPVPLRRCDRLDREEPGLVCRHTDLLVESFLSKDSPAPSPAF